MTKIKHSSSFLAVLALTVVWENHSIGKFISFHKFYGHTTVTQSQDFRDRAKADGGRGKAKARHTEQERSAKLTNQRVSYAFTCSPFSFHARHILHTSKFQHSYSCILLIFYRHQWTACVRIRTVSVNTVHWFDASCSVTPVNTSITFITSTVPGLHFLPLTVYAQLFIPVQSEFSPKARTPTD